MDRHASLLKEINPDHYPLLGVSLDIENYCTLRLIFNRKS